MDSTATGAAALTSAATAGAPSGLFDDPVLVILIVLVIAITILALGTARKSRRGDSTGVASSEGNLDRLGDIMNSAESGGAPAQPEPDPLNRLANFESTSRLKASDIEKHGAAPAESRPIQHAGTASSGESKPVNDGAGVLTQYKAGGGEGISEVEAMLEKDPNNLELLDWLAFMYYSNNMLDKALVSYEKALSMDPDNVNQLYYLGSTYFKMGRKEDAVVKWQRVVELKPDSKIARKAQDKIDKSA